MDAFAFGQIVQTESVQTTVGHCELGVQLLFTVLCQTKCICFHIHNNCALHWVPGSILGALKTRGEGVVISKVTHNIVGFKVMFECVWCGILKCTVFLSWDLLC